MLKNILISIVFPIQLWKYPRVFWNVWQTMFRINNLIMGVKGLSFLWILLTDFNYPSVELQAYSGKVHNLLWSQQYSPQHLFSCGPDGQITWWNIICTNGETTTFNVTPLCIFTLPPSKQRWASAIEIFQLSNKETVTNKSALIVCGDRKGSLHLFDASTGDLSAEKASCLCCSLQI